MPFAATVSTAADTIRALEEAAAQAKVLMPGKIDVTFLFFSPHHMAGASQISQIARELLQPGCLLGCAGESIIANSHEIEVGPAMTLWVGRWNSDVKVSPFHLTLEQTSEDLSILGWPDELEDARPEDSSLLLLADAATFSIDDLLQHVNDDHPGLRVMGGMASGANQPGDNPLLIDGRVVREGAVGMLLQGPVKVRSVVSQGCRPIGKPLVVTKAHDNIILELGGKAPLLQLQELWQELDPREQKLVQEGLHVGRVINEYQEAFQRGDFLVRNVIGLDRNTGALAVNDRVRVGQTVQFHVRDAETAGEDLHALLRKDAETHQQKPAGALLFSCNGRGRHMFEQPHHDAQAVQKEAGQVPLAGFFAQGELGPVGGQNFIHGFTASIVLFED